VHAVNAETILLYYDSGRTIRAEQTAKGWGAGVIQQLSIDLKHDFPDTRGYSPRHLRYMRDFADAWPDEQVVRDVLVHLSWSHNVLLLEQLSESDVRLWYAHAAVREGWTRPVLRAQISSQQHLHQGRALTNFPTILPESHAILAQALFRDHYVLDVVGLRSRVRERDLENALLARMRTFFLALGGGFALVGSQYRLEVEGEEFFVDLLFYQAALGRYVAFDLKTGKFKPEYVSKMAFYLKVIDQTLPNAAGQPSIGIILCTDRKQTVVEFTLGTTVQPMGVATYETLNRLSTQSHVSDGLCAALPTPEALHAEITAVLEEFPVSTAAP
jgi:predicted nuclease of restriction endonuclease-like (RecB) superfamily